MADSDYESVLCVKPEVHVYRVPPRASNRGYRAAEWQLDQPSWSGRLRITSKGKMAFIKLEDKNSGELFAQAPVDQFPSIAVEGVTDSSRYFVIRVEDESGRRAFIGVGFVDRGDAFDFNVAIQDHFKWVKQQSEFAKQALNPDQGPKLDLGFKEGQTIKLNIANMKKKEGAAGNSKPRPGALSLLPPPPAGRASALIPPPGEQLPSYPADSQPTSAANTGLCSWASFLFFRSIYTCQCFLYGAWEHVYGTSHHSVRDIKITSRKDRSFPFKPVPFTDGLIPSSLDIVSTLFRGMLV
ncbi:transcription factor HIVEP3 [Platysternon megacephalum]|uniref:Transcription factor HIVEP3 n=1 Tax=Platysternon megacephalum TaxID=55544 RepID=A0A4D9F8C3_9SAUR|nr:transcription factor HIVEP3 [Platysternon megacephalum]